MSHLCLLNVIGGMNLKYLVFLSAIIILDLGIDRLELIVKTYVHDINPENYRQYLHNNEWLICIQLLKSLK